jgi:hypothetical protein
MPSFASAAATILRIRSITSGFTETDVMPHSRGWVPVSAKRSEIVSLLFHARSK